MVAVLVLPCVCFWLFVLSVALLTLHCFGVWQRRERNGSHVDLSGLMYVDDCMSDFAGLLFFLLARKGMMMNWNVNVVITAELGSKGFASSREKF